jgi:hypothetical protein
LFLVASRPISVRVHAASAMRDARPIPRFRLGAALFHVVAPTPSPCRQPQKRQDQQERQRNPWPGKYALYYHFECFE